MNASNCHQRYTSNVTSKVGSILMWNKGQELCILVPLPHVPFRVCVCVWCRSAVSKVSGRTLQWYYDGVTGYAGFHAWAAPPPHTGYFRFSRCTKHTHRGRGRATLMEPLREHMTCINLGVEEEKKKRGATVDSSLNKKDYGSLTTSCTVTCMFGVVRGHL